MLTLSNTNLMYDGDVQALFNVSLSVNTGELVTIVGGNGAGKTSLIRMVSGILPTHSGRIVFKGQDINGYSHHEIAELGMGHVAEGRQIFPTMTVLENLEVGGSLKRSRLRIRKNLQHVFELFPRLSERMSQLAGTLSGGEQQMLAMGRCLMAEPELILFDEPSLGLSPIMVQSMFRMIEHLHQTGMTIILVEQNVMASLKIADRGYVLENGSVVLEGTTDELLGHEGIRKSYLGV